MLFGGAVYYRKKPAAHKSLMLLTAINFVPPALARIPIAPLLNLGPVWFFGFPTLVILSCLGIDWRRRGRINLVFLAGSVLLTRLLPKRREPSSSNQMFRKAKPPEANGRTAASRFVK